MIPRLVAFACVASACSAGGPTVFTEAETLGGETIDAETLNAGYQGYVAYCAACHGEDGDGRGPASVGLATPPRDFRIATFKFTGAEDGRLPHDDDLARIVVDGLDGTAMSPWSMPDDVMYDIIDYIKTFSPEGKGYRSERAKLTEPLPLDTDPWGAQRRDEAIARGRVVYHGLANCYSCHAAYATTTEINAARAAFEQPPLTEPRDQVWLPTPRASDVYSAPIVGDPVCEKSSDCGGDGTLCRFGRCERKLVLMPPDFTLNRVRTGTEVTSLYRIIARGIPGTAMPAWAGALPEEDVWAMAYFVQDVASWPVERGFEVKRQLQDER